MKKYLLLLSLGLEKAKSKICHYHPLQLLSELGIISRFNAYKMNKLALIMIMIILKMKHIQEEMQCFQIIFSLIEKCFMKFFNVGSSIFLVVSL